MKLTIEAERLTRELDTLAAFSAAPVPAVTRVVFSQEDLQARQWLKNLCTDAGLEIREDAIGNTFARWRGSLPLAPAVGTGSHMDAIPHSGRYDGTVGVLGGLEAIRSLARAGFQPGRSVELLLFTSEEPTRFGIGCVGSRLMSGTLDATIDENLRDSEGLTLKDVRVSAGFGGSLDSVKLPADYYGAFVELHIEQGPLLERAGSPIGAVTAIAAPASLRISIQGEGGHAGAVLMPARHDAFLAAAQIALALENIAKSTGAIDSVATTGICDIFPRAINSIPSRAQLEADIRDIDGARRDRIIQALEEACRDISAARGVAISHEFINRDAPARCDPRIVDTICESASVHHLRCDRMVSRAYHDSLFMSRICPTAMIFIPCRDGVSHRPDEYSAPHEIAAGALVLAETLAALSAA